MVLASQSPRRAQLLELLGLALDVRPADIELTWPPHEEPAPHAERLAREKAEAVIRTLPVQDGDLLVIGSDTVVALEGVVLGKPADAEDAVRMLLRLEGRTHLVATGIAVATGGAVLSAVECVRVHFRGFDAATARAYVATGEPLDKAGAYGIQGYGSALVDRIEGDFFAVMGFPIARFIDLLARHGWRYDFRGLERLP
ncbi:MAG: septum formation protein Maf [Gemmatimonadetes bacterium]|nr:septum formation protein Maf [Gemmatimonadota bacterium]